MKMTRRVSASEKMISNINIYLSGLINVKYLLAHAQAMASELNMYESQVSEYKYEIERLARELQEVKKKYFMQKKKEQASKYVESWTFSLKVRRFVDLLPQST